MFPHAHYAPTSLRKKLIGLTVAGTIVRYLRTPEFAILSRGSIMGGTAVPEAAITKHRYLRTEKNHVSSPADAGLGADVYSIPQAKSAYGTS